MTGNNWKPWQTVTALFVTFTVMVAVVIFLNDSHTAAVDKYIKYIIELHDRDMKDLRGDIGEIKEDVKVLLKR